MTETKLLVVVPDATANHLRVAKIKRGSDNRPQLAGGNQCCIDRCEAGSVDREDVIHDRALRVTRQVEVRMVGEIDRRRCRGSRLVLDGQRVVIVQPIGGVRSELPRVTLLACRAHVGEPQRLPRRSLDRLGLPHALVEAFSAAMQGIGRIVPRQLVGLAIQCKTAVGDAIGIAPDTGAEIRHPGQIGIEAVEAQYDVLETTRPIGRLQRHYGGPVRHNADFDAAHVGQRVDFHGLLSGTAERISRDRGARVFRRRRMRNHASRRTRGAGEQSHAKAGCPHSLILPRRGPYGNLSE